MQSRFTIFVLLLAFAAAGTFAQDAPPPPPAMDDAMLKAIATASPNENHEKLAQYLGTWDVHSSWWLGGPDKPPTADRGTAKITWAFEGRFLRQEFQGYFMGMPMTGLGFNGYDNMKKAYTMLWIDNTSTAMYAAEGGPDATGRGFVFTGKMDDPMTGEMNKTVRYLLKDMVNDAFTFEIHEVPAKGKAIKIAELSYKRAQEHK